MSRRDALAARRKAMGLTQEALAFDLGVDVTTVARWERGLVEPLPAHRQALAVSLSVSMDQLGGLLEDDRVHRVGRSRPEAGTAISRGDELIEPLHSMHSGASGVPDGSHHDGQLEVRPGRFFGGGTVASRSFPAREEEGRIVVQVPRGVLAESVVSRPGPSIVLGAVDGGQRVFAVDARRAGRRLARSATGAALVVPPPFELDDLTEGILWAMVNLDMALLGDDARLARRQRGLSALESRPRSLVPDDAADDLSAVSQMWLGSDFCARHILRHIAQLAVEPPVFWTQEQRGEEASAWLFFAHKHAYLQELADRYPSSAVSRVFCVPDEVVAASPPAERVLFFLAAALMESFGIEVVVSVAPEYAGLDGFVLDRDRQAIVASWIGADGLWHVDVTDARPTVREFADASGYARSRSAIAQPTPDGRLRGLADRLALDWPWLVSRCAALGDYGCAGFIEPRSRLLSTDGADRACRYVGKLPASA